jgi:protein MAK16
MLTLNKSSKLWEKIPLSRNYSKALEQLEENLAYFPKNIIHRNKQRLTKIHQYLIRMRKLELRQRAGKKVKMTQIHRKIDQREERREKKAVVAANLEKSIEKELVERLARGTYGDIYNFPEVPYQRALDEVANKQEEDAEDSETESAIKEEEEMDTDEEDAIIEYVEDLEDDEDMEDYEEEGSFSEGEYEDSSDKDTSDDEVTNTSGKEVRKQNPKESGKNKRTRIEIEYEEEEEEDFQLQDTEATAGTAW